MVDSTQSEAQPRTRSREKRDANNFTPLPPDLEQRRKGYWESLAEEAKAFRREFLTPQGWKDRDEARKRFEELANGKKKGKHENTSQPPPKHHTPFTLKSWFEEIRNAIKGDWPDNPNK